jgi:hypothetical protein
MLVRIDHRARGLERPERAGKRHLLVVVDRLVADDQHTVLLHAEVDAVQGVGIRHGAQVDAAHLGHEYRVQRNEAQGHGVTPIRAPRATRANRHFKSARAPR